jgi:3-dehydroquinate synthase
MMEIITLKTATAETKIFVDSPFTNFKKEEILRSAQNDIAVIIDSNVFSIYGNKLSEFNVIEINPGEESKSLNTIEHIYNQLIDYSIDRKGIIIGIGGGVVCDIAGYTASTYLRGVRFGFVASTLLAQVDAAIGGKNGVNLQGYKNIIGTITQPEFVICDLAMLDTLPVNEYRCGLAEIVKAALAGNKELFLLLEQNIESINKKEKTILKRIIPETIKFKVTVVEQDEKDNGIRNILNLGHTFAHAIESKTGMSHGEAVSIGLCKASEISVKMGLFDNEVYDSIKSLLNKFDLPTELKFSFAELLPSIIKDKKKVNEYINFILLKGIGEPVIHKFKLEELRKLF